GSSKTTSTQPSSISTGPEIVVFDEASKKKQIKPTTVYEWKSFMSSKISKLKDKPAPKLQKNDEEVEEEELNKKNDKELQELLETSKLLELYTADRLTGKERRKYNDKKIVELGAKSPKSIKIPTPISLGIQSK
ncbi:997_t:CDS:2, partial [Acaulospora morrowiae]